MTDIARRSWKIVVALLPIMVALISWGGSADAVCTPLGTSTPGLGLCKPNNGETGWTNAINGNWDILDTAVPSGAVMFYAGATPPAAWYACDGSAKSRTSDSGLFAAIGTTFGAGDGSTTFNLPDMRSRVPRGSGQASFVASAASAGVNVTTDEMAIPSNESLFTGTVIVLNTSGAVPGGLTANTTYYVIRVSATSVKLATSMANAVAGTAINLTSQGSGTHSLTVTYTTRNLGDRGGEDTHAMAITEMPAHTHTFSAVQNVSGAVAAAAGGSGNKGVSSNSTGATGGSSSHNVMDPFLVLTCMIKR